MRTLAALTMLLAVLVPAGPAVAGSASSRATSLCVNPSLTIAALAERASAAVVARAADSGVAVVYGAPAPGGETAARRATLPLASTLGA